MGTGMSEQILKTKVRLFRDSSITHSTSMFVANQMIVKSEKSLRKSGREVTCDHTLYLP